VAEMVAIRSVYSHLYFPSKCETYTVAVSVGGASAVTARG